MERQDIKGVHQLRRDTSSNWTSENPILWDGQEGYETDTRRKKVGDGETAWNDLPYAVKVGGVNYLVNSKLDNLLGWGQNGDSLAQATAEKYQGYDCVVLRNNGSAYNPGIITNRFTASTDELNESELVVSVGIFSSKEGVKIAQYPSLVIPANQWVRVSYPYKLFNGTTFALSVNGISANETVGIKNIKLERGNIPTDWTPATGDETPIRDYSGSEVPTLNNYPASSWATTADREKHIGEYYSRKVTSNILRNTNFDVVPEIMGGVLAAESDWNSFYWGKGGFTSEDSADTIREVVSIINPPLSAIKKGIRIYSNTPAREINVRQFNVPLVIGKTYTYSAYVKGSLSGDSRLFISYSLAGGTTFNEKLVYSISDSWQLVSMTFVADTSSVKFYVGIYGSGDVQFCGMKLEEGINDNPEWSDYSSEPNYTERYQFAGANGVYGWDKVSYRDDATLGMAADGVYVMYHRNSDNFPLAVKPERWPAWEETGEVAEGVLLIHEGRGIIIAPDESQQVWATTAVGTGKYNSQRLVALDDFAGKQNTENMLKLSGANAATYCNSYSRVNANSQGLSAGMWWLPSLGELMLIFSNFDKINYALSFIKGAVPLKKDGYWSSSEYNQTAKWQVLVENLSISAKTCSDSNNTRPVSCFAHLTTDTPVPTAKELAEEALSKINGTYNTTGNTLIDDSTLDLSTSNGSVSVAVNIARNGAVAVLIVPANVKVSFSVHPSQSYTLKMADGVADLSGDASGKLVYTLLRAGNMVYITGALYA